MITLKRSHLSPVHAINTPQRVRQGLWMSNADTERGGWRGKFNLTNVPSALSLQNGVTSKLKLKIPFIEECVFLSLCPLKCQTLTILTYTCSNFIARGVFTFLY